jgi:hypothetical protein
MAKNVCSSKADHKTTNLRPAEANTLGPRYKDIFVIYIHRFFLLESFTTFLKIAETKRAKVGIFIPITNTNYLVG